MPRAVVPKKDAVGSDIRRGGVNIPRSGGFRMEQSILFYRKLHWEDGRKTEVPMRGAPPELKHLSRVRKRNTNEIPSVAASEIGTVQTRLIGGGCGADNVGVSSIGEYPGMGSQRE